jgi:hypothetical protein
MSRAGTGSRPSANALSAQANRIDACIRAGGAVTVAGLAGVAGAISYSHTRQLAAVDSEVAWRTRAFPLSVDVSRSWPRWSCLPTGACGAAHRKAPACACAHCSKFRGGLPRSC